MKTKLNLKISPSLQRLQCVPETPKRNFLCLVVLLVLCGVFPVKAQTLLLRYTFDEASGNALDGGQAPAADGTFSGGAVRTTNTPGAFSSGAVDLTDFSNLPFIDGGSPSKLDGLTNFTLTVWLNLQNSPSSAICCSNNRRLLAKQGGGFEGFSWNLNNTGLGSGYTAANFKMALFIGGANGFQNGISDTATGADHRWRFLAVSYDGNLTSANVVFYVGDETNSVAQLGSIASINDGATTPSAAGFKVGNTDAASTLNTAPPGWLDDARVYSGVLNATQLDAVRLDNLVLSTPPAQAVQILNPARSGSGVTFSFVTQNSHTHTVEYKNSLSDANWQTLLTIPGTGATTNITDSGVATRFYRVGTQ